MEDYIDLSLKPSDENILTNKLDLFLQEISLSIETSPGEIYGIRDGIDLKQFLFNNYITTNQIRNKISSYISQNCEHAKYFQYTINVETMKIENKEICYILFQITLTNNQIIEHKFLIG